MTECNYLMPATQWQPYRRSSAAAHVGWHGRSLTVLVREPNPRTHGNSHIRNDVFLIERSNIDILNDSAKVG
jgi:hypothetical protein